MFGQKIRELRQEKGLTLAEVAELTGFTASSISQYEMERRDNPSRATIERFAKALDTTPDYLMSAEKREPSVIHMILTKEESSIITLLRNGMKDGAIQLINKLAAEAN